MTRRENGSDRASLLVKIARLCFSIGVGGVYENYLDCNDSVYGTCSDWYPEIFFSSSF
jgi:hypothetical protein